MSPHTPGVPAVRGRTEMKDQEVKAEDTGAKTPQSLSKFRKKPVVIDAWLFDGSYESYAQVPSGGMAQWFSSGHSGRPPCVEIQTLEGKMTAMPGDWIIRGIKGEFYPCKSDIFEGTYEAAAVSPVQAPTVAMRCPGLAADDEPCELWNGHEGTCAARSTDGSPVQTLRQSPAVSAERAPQKENHDEETNQRVVDASEQSDSERRSAGDTDLSGRIGTAYRGDLQPSAAPEIAAERAPQQTSAIAILLEPLIVSARSIAAHERTHLGHVEIANVIESLCAALAASRVPPERLQDDAYNMHWPPTGLLNKIDFLAKLTRLIRDDVQAERVSGSPEPTSRVPPEAEHKIGCVRHPWASELLERPHIDRRTPRTGVTTQGSNPQKW